MTLRDYMTALIKNWIVILVLAIVGGGVAYAYSQFLPEQYRAEAQVMVISTRGENTSELVQGSNYVQSLMQSYTILVKTPTVLDPVIDDLDLEMDSRALASRVDVNVPINSVMIEIGVTDRDPEIAQSAANAIAFELANAVGDLSPVGADSRPAVRIDTISAAQVPSFAIAPNTRLNVVFGVLAGFAVGVIFAILRRILGSRLVTAKDVHGVTPLPVLGEVVAVPDGTTLASTLRTSPDSRAAESLRKTAASLKFVDVDHERRVLLVTSASSGEGKTSVSLALALTLAEVGHRVLYMEADLRRPSASRYTQIEGSVGLTTIIIGEATLASAVQSWGHPNLDVLTSGEQPPNPGQLLSGGKLSRVIEEARHEYEYVIVDTAPILAVSDAQWLTPLTDGCIFVVRVNRTRAEDLRRSVAALESMRSAPLGVVLNGVKPDTRSPYYTAEARPSSLRRRSSRNRVGASSRANGTRNTTPPIDEDASDGRTEPAGRAD